MKKTTWISLFLNAILALVPLVGLATEEVSCSTEPMTATFLFPVKDDGIESLKDANGTSYSLDNHLHQDYVRALSICTATVPHGADDSLPEELFLRWPGRTFSSTPIDPKQLPLVFALFIEVDSASKVEVDTPLPNGNIYHSSDELRTGGQLSMAYVTAGEQAIIRIYDLKGNLIVETELLDLFAFLSEQSEVSIPLTATEADTLRNRELGSFAGKSFTQKVPLLRSKRAITVRIGLLDIYYPAEYPDVGMSLYEVFFFRSPTLGPNAQW